MTSFLHIVLIEPEIPQNTGNIGRTCVGLDAELHLIGPLGFSLEEKDLKRAGLDYWPKLKSHYYPKWKDFEKSIPMKANMVFFSTKGHKDFWNHGFVTSVPVFLIFGSESRGLPPSFYEKYKNKLLRIPHSNEIRSLNLATSVGIAAYEVFRQQNAGRDIIKT